MTSPEVRPLAERTGTAAVYHLETDDALISLVGKFPLISNSELSVLAERSYSAVKRRMPQLVRAHKVGRTTGVAERMGYYDEIQCTSCGATNRIEHEGGRVIPSPYFYFLKKPNGDPDAIVWQEKAKSHVDHDRGLCVMNIALHNAFGSTFTEWRQQRDDVKVTVEREGKHVSFFPDARFKLEDTTYWLEYGHSDPSSTEGVSDNVEKAYRYNAMMREHYKEYRQDAGKVLFIFRQVRHVESFIKRIADELPYLWLMATDFESFKHDPKGKIYWTPKDFDKGTHGLVSSSDT